MEPDRRLRELAERQHALVTVRQARSLVSPWQLRARLAGPDWVRETARVLRLEGAPRTDEQVLMGAALDTGGVVSHSSAAALWHLPSFAFGPVEVSRLRGASGSRPSGGHLHEPRWLPESDITEVRGVPVTTLPRTLFDLAGRLPPGRTERLVASVVGRSPRLLPVLHRMLEELAERGRGGITVMRAILEQHPVGSMPEQTGLERRVNWILRGSGEPPLTPQVDVGGHEWIGRVDFRDPIAPHVLYEIDSLVHHSATADRLRDAARDNALLAAGFCEVVRIPEEHVWYAPDRVVAAVRARRYPVLAATS